MPPSVDESAAAETPGAFRGGGGGWSGPERDEQELSRFGFGSYHPAVLLGLLVYGCATGGILPAGSWNEPPTIPCAFRFIATNDHPGPRHHRHIPATVSARRSRRCSSRCCCWRARWSAQDGPVALDGTKITPMPAATAHCRIEHAGKIEAQLKAEVADLLAKAEAADQADARRHVDTGGTGAAQK